ncbi:MAG: M48 family metalloprotease [Acidobacteriota bacterium]
MNESKATRYQRLHRRATNAGWVMAGLMLSLVAFTPVARWLRDEAWLFASGLPPFLATTVALGCFLVAVLVLWEMASLPALIYTAVVVDGAYGRTAGDVESAILTQLQVTFFVLPAVLFSGAVVAVSAQRAGPWWWIAAGLVLSVALMFVLHGGPRLFSRMAAVHAVSRPPLAARLRQLAARVRVPVAGIDEWNVSDASVTAIVTGIGASRRVMISADLVRQWSDDEIEVVVAHELAHHAHHDLWQTFALNVVVLSLALWAADIVVSVVGPVTGVSGPGDLAALPLMALATFVIWALATPIRHAQSRRQERLADEAALIWTGHAEAFGSAVRRLGAKHLAEERPSRLTRWLYHRHPPMAERLALAQHYTQAKAKPRS